MRAYNQSVKAQQGARPDFVAVGRALAVHPGFLFVASLALAGLMNRLVPLPVATRLETTPVQKGVGALVLGATLVMVWSIATFRRHATPFEPSSKPASLLASGPFRLSRNPMYAALLAISLGVAVLGASLWFFASTIALAAILDRIVIPREETILQERFGEAFDAYRTRVRRWI